MAVIKMYNIIIVIKQYNINEINHFRTKFIYDPFIHVYDSSSHHYACVHSTAYRITTENKKNNRHFRKNDECYFLVIQLLVPNLLRIIT